MTPHVQAVMDRYRALKAEGLTGLAASAQTRDEFQQGLSPQNVPTEDVPAPMSPAQPAVIELCKKCGRRQPPLGRTECDACRKATYRERSK